MAKVQISTRRIAISKANAQMVAILGVASFLTVFSLVASKTLLSQNKFLGDVIDRKEAAKTQLDANIAAFNQLVKSYKSFDGKKVNVLGGQRDGAGELDGNNARLVLDALPGAYDFPALTSSLEKILISRSLVVTNIIGTDDQLNQLASDSPSPTAVEMPFSFSITNASYDSVLELFQALERSIRPLQIDEVKLAGNQTDMTLTVTGHTFYQPAKSLTIKKETVKQ